MSFGDHSRRLIDINSEEARRIYEEARGKSPPIENPPDTSIPENYDRSAEMVPFEDDVNINNALAAFSAEWSPISKEKGITMLVGVFTAVTESSCPYHTRKFFLVDLHTDDIGREHEVHEQLVEMLKKHFPENDNRFKDLYPVRIRYDENGAYLLQRILSKCTMCTTKFSGKTCRGKRSL